jgi:hypothetical protein
MATQHSLLMMGAARSVAALVILWMISVGPLVADDLLARWTGPQERHRIGHDGRVVERGASEGSAGTGSNGAKVQRGADLVPRLADLAGRPLISARCCPAALGSSPKPSTCFRLQDRGPCTRSVSTILPSRITNAQPTRDHFKWSLWPRSARHRGVSHGVRSQRQSGK